MADAERLLGSLIEELKKQGCISSARVDEALRRVPRHWFLPGVPLERVYRDEAVITKRLNGMGVSSCSQPVVVATMLEQLILERGHRVLEIGAGTGYNAALIAHQVGDKGHVTTIDIDNDIVENAHRNLASAGFDMVEVICGDGGYGHPERAPYDRIILTVGAWDIAPAWTEQLKPDGLLLLPLWLRGTQKTIAFRKVDGHLDSVSISDCSFMPLRGAFAGPISYAQLGGEPVLSIMTEKPDGVDAEATYDWLTGPSRDLRTPVRLTGREIWQSLTLWLALREAGFCNIAAQGEIAKRRLIPCLFNWSGICATVGLIGDTNLCVLMRRSSVRSAESKPFNLWVRSYGPDERLAHRLIEQVMAWDAAGRPSSQRLRVRAYPKDADYTASAGELVIAKRWTSLILDWE